VANAIVVIVGDEILEGHTQDTNSHYLAKRLQARGVDLVRIVTVSDQVEDIAACLDESLARRPDFIFVCGGIGPTPDDRTYEAVAMALGLPLTVSPADEAWMKARLAQRGYGQGLLDDPDKAEALLRMIRRPEGTPVLENPIGAALGTAARAGATTLFVLPGVPRELTAMMEQVIEPRYLAASTRSKVTLELEVHGEEARLYPILRELEMTNPHVKLGSYPQDDKGRIILRIQGETTIAEAVAKRLADATGARRVG
jgi:nicotinamide-nucleotide amidase